MKKLNLSIHVTADNTSIQILHDNGKRKEIIRSIHVFSSQELEPKKAWMQKKIDNYNVNGQI